jgi:hypothetical protein
MYRGDLIDLLDYWPLDDVNTVGGGAGYRRGRLQLAAHVGANRLTEDFQYQMVEVPDPNFGADEIVQLDRQRYNASATSIYRFWGDGIGPSASAKLYAEAHVLPRGVMRRSDQTFQELPRDAGWSLGAQLGMWGFGPRNSHANLFARFSQGLTAHDELEVPTGLNSARKTFPASSEFVLGWSGNFEQARAGTLVGGYARRFVDADGLDSLDDGWEYIVDVRPYWAVSNPVQLAVDLSYQRRMPRGVSPTSLMAIEPEVVQAAPMLVYSPFGRGSYTRPQFRLIYRLAHLDRDARDLFSVDDPRRDRPWVHFAGMQAEWWFNSTYR